ncbi:MAG TPA: PD-(D/E)XK nuclease family protein [Solirubrobacteraceae bacterium]|nr:PD-(D/E)XK nuclease family protein [Solirubrobacteraceae bacterium]
MPITLITGPANAGKAGVVMDALRAHRARGEQPLLIVPTYADVERYRLELGGRELASEGVAAGAGVERGARVEPFQGLLAEVLRRAGSAERLLGRLARERALAAVLQSVGGVRPTAGVVRSLAALVGELEVERVTPARLRGALDTWAAADPGYAPHARELGKLFEGYHRGLERLRPARVSPERQAARALDALRRAPALWGVTPVLLYGFDDFTRLQLDTIETLGAVVGAPVTVSLAYEPGRVAFASRGDTFQRLLPLAAEHLPLSPRAEHYAPGARTALHHLERHIFEPGAPAPVPAGEALRLLEGGGERAELELVAQEIRGLLEREVQPGEIAVAHRSPETIAELLEEVFRAHRIPFALRRRLSFARTATGRALLGLLRATFPEAADDGGGLGDLLAWLRAPGVLRSPELVDELEWRARRAGVSSAARARALWEAERWPLETLDRLREAAQRSPAALIERTAAELGRLGFAPQAPASADVREAPTPSEQHEARALAVGQEALEELRELACSAPDLAPDAHELIALLRGLELIVGEGAGEGVPAATMPEAVAVLDPLALRARRVRALFLCGLQEGVFPAPARPEPYLAEDERRGLAEASGLRLGRPGDALAAERYLLYAAISRPRELLVLSWHTADDDGLPAARSLFVDDICDLFAGDLHETRSRRALGEMSTIVQAESPPGAIRALGEVSPIAPTEYGAPPGEIRPLRDPRVLADLGERLWSASGLQSWAGCPVQWFVERMLSARELEPEAEPLARGGLAHAALRQTLERLREDTGSARLTTERLPHARELLRAALQEHEREHPLSTVPERIPGVRRRLEADLERYLEHAAACGDRADVAQLDLAQRDSPSQLEPTYLELPFGFADRVSESPGAPDASGGAPLDLDGGAPIREEPAGALPALDLDGGVPAREEPAGALPALDLGEGVRVRGFIDRVDLAPGGEAVVYDYKSSIPVPPDRWLGERNFQIALYMRAVAQLVGVPVAGGFYQPLSGRDLRARGVLAAEEGVVLECVRGDARPPSEVRELVEEILAAARTAAAQARAGALEARPATCGFGGSGCMYPSICRCDR